jgi:hypothetical protein
LRKDRNGRDDLFFLGEGDGILDGVELIEKVGYIYSVTRAISDPDALVLDLFHYFSHIWSNEHRHI